MSYKKAKPHTCLRIFAILAVAITFILIAIAFACPEWLLSKTDSNDKTDGLWLECEVTGNSNTRWSECRWYFDKDFHIQKTLEGEQKTIFENFTTGMAGSVTVFSWPVNGTFIKTTAEAGFAWYVAVQVLFSLALAFSAIAVILASFASFCRSCRIYSVTCGIINFTFLLLVTTVAVFGAEAYVNDRSPTRVIFYAGVNQIFGWCYWVAVAATGTSLISTILFYVLARKMDYGDYEYYRK